ncbi:MAG: hypothetical protein ACLUD0_05870 [Eubacterium ramulus]
MLACIAGRINFRYCALQSENREKELKKQADGLKWNCTAFIRIVAGNLPISFEKRQKLFETRIRDRAVRSIDADSAV